MRKIVAFFFFMLAGAWALAVSAQPLLPGEAVATCFSGATPSDDVVAVLDIRAPATNGAIIDKNWNPPRGAHWTLSDLGTQVFGIALDDASVPRIYVTSTTTYNSVLYTQPPPAPGRTLGEIYRLDSVTGGSTVFATLPNTGQGLGNIAYDRKHKQFFVTNFYDGRIYRVSSTGVVLPNRLDPGAPFVGSAPAPLSERVWGVAVFQDRVYFGTWGPGQVYSVAIDPATGDFSGPIDAQGLLPAPTAMPIADIEFSAGGKMLIAERGVTGSLTIAHQAKVLEFSGGNPWVSSGSIFSLGSFANGRNSSGGVDYNCAAEAAGAVVATGDALHLVPHDQIYGLQLFPPQGGTTANSYLIDLDGDAEVQDKTEIGDVDVYNTCDRHCSELTGVKVLCATDGTGNFIVQFQVKNLSSAPVFHAFLAGLPSGVTATPDHFGLGAGLAPGQVSQVFQTTIHGAQPGQQLTFDVTLHDQNLAECCATRHTITLPRCDCAQVIADRGPTCRFPPHSGFNYSFTLQSLFPQPPAFVLIVPDLPATATLSPNVVPFTGNPQNISLALGNVASGQQVCFLASLHTSDFERCCSIRKCVTLPRCFDFSDPIPILDTAIAFELEGLHLASPGLAPGVRLPLTEGTTRFDLAWRPADAAALRVGGTLEQSVEGVVGEDGVKTVARLVTTRTAEGAELRASFPGLGATRQRFEFYRNGERVGVRPNVSGETPAICNCGPRITTDAHFSVRGSVPASEENAASCDGPGPGCLFAGFTFPAANAFHLAGSDVSFVADEVRVIPENGSGAVRSLATAEIRASGLANLTLTDFRADRDCNGNGIPDYDEITRGGGLDLDRDGILDVCQASAALAINLATGFDQAAGTLLKPRANDDDWRLVEPGTERPASVIAHTNEAWPAPLPGSLWVGAEPERGDSARGVSIYRYERCFCLSTAAREVTLDLRLQADDRARVLLNGQAVSGLGGGFRTEPMGVRRTGAVGDGLFVAGENCVAVEVRDPGAVATGFTLAGLLTAPGGACRP